MGPCIQTCIQHWISLVYLGNQIFINHTNSASGLSHLTALLRAYQTLSLSISEYSLLLLLIHLLMQLNIYFMHRKQFILHFVLHPVIHQFLLLV